ncbi:nucleotidyltransferase family protein [Flavobacteriaceae bacterium S356]|uniref:Nucleotidyltransferase family protein n=1 Tax=Asprobacillus argus TaxID=3076534 RepID=A0ABU3LIM9_9FLAO|nr:nucleotidyltransferase family protein [Flavobacteriaceae bacterium S356]
MSYKETLFFIAKCLTISHETANYVIVKNAVEKETVDWDSVVKVSTEHYVFPALYCNLKRKELLSHLPKDLVEYMQHIATLNKDRNLQIKEQALEINKLLKTRGILPVFLKGTGFLLQGFYENIAERMIGDIDFIVSEKDYENAITVLKKNGYGNKAHKLDNVKLGKHYPRLIHKEKIAAVEVHFRILKEPYDEVFNYEFVKNHTVELPENIRILNYDHQVLHTVFNKQANDLGYWYKTISLRNCYDLFLLSKKTNTLSAIKSVSKHFDILNAFLASCHFVFNHSTSITFDKNRKTNTYIHRQLELLDTPKKMKKNRQLWDIYFNSKTRFKKLKLAFTNKDVRTHLFNLMFKR